MKQDIQTFDDIVLLVDDFYSKAMIDPEIGDIFTDVAAIDLKEHMPVMYEFWSGILLGQGNYRGGLMGKHIALHAKSRLLPSHFERWKQLFFQTLDAHFLGSKVDECKQRVESMITLMQFKLQQSENSSFIQ